MEETTKRRWDVRLGVATSLLAVVGLIFGGWQFLTQQRNNIRLSYDLQERGALSEFRREVFLLQLESFKNVSSTVGRIVSSVEAGRYSGALYDEFSTFYWGTMILVEDDLVEEAMVNFRRELLNLQTGWGTEIDVKSRGIDLIDALRNSIEAGYQDVL